MGFIFYHMGRVMVIAFAIMGLVCNLFIVDWLILGIFRFSFVVGCFVCSLNPFLELE